VPVRRTGAYRHKKSPAYIYSAVDKSQLIPLEPLFDVSAAFDMVDHGTWLITAPYYNTMRISYGFSGTPLVSVLPLWQLSDDHLW